MEEVALSDQQMKGGAGPAIAAHSKDGSIPGQTPASSATGHDGNAPSGGSGTISGAADQAGETATSARQGLADGMRQAVDDTSAFVREQPLLALASVGVVCLAVGMFLGRR